jgi:hypothetical protein
MEKRLSGVVAGAVALPLAIAFFASLAQAQDHRGDRRDVQRRSPERREVQRERFRTPHMVFDNRFHHDHYYPRLGYNVTVLPPGHVSITFRGAPFFFHSGVWYRRSGPSFVVVRPPLGIIVPILPPGYATVVVAGRPYYYANEVYYVEASGGYAVAEAPVGVPEDAAAAPPPQAGTSGAAAGSGVWYYCESSKTYYPYVSECKEGWRAVPATPASVR